MSTNRSRSASAFRDRNANDMLPTRLYNLSRSLVKICRHTASDWAIVPSELGWLPMQQVIAQVSDERNTGLKGHGKVHGGGSATHRAGDNHPYELQEVIQIVERARRPHLGLIENHGGRVINIRAWDFHVGLRPRNAVADYGLESLVAPTTHPPGPTAGRTRRRQIRGLHRGSSERAAGPSPAARLACAGRAGTTRAPPHSFHGREAGEGELA